MSMWTSCIPTAKGRALQAKAEAGALLRITKMRLGSGETKAEDIETMTELKQPVLDVPISSTSAKDGICTVKGGMWTSEVATGFYARELGLYAQDPDEGEILYMVSIDSAADFVPPASFKPAYEVSYTMHIGFGSAQNVSINVGSNSLVDVELLQRSARMLQRNTEYVQGDLVYDLSLPTSYILHCDRGGTTARGIIDFGKAVPGMIYADGTVRWEVRRICTSVNGMDEVERLGAEVKKLQKMCSMMMKLTKAGEILNTAYTLEAPTEKTAWIRPEVEPECRYSPHIRIVAENGNIMDNPMACIEYPGGKRLRITSEWESLEGKDKVMACEPFKIITEDGTILLNTTAQIVDEKGRKKLYSTNGVIESIISAEESSISKADIDNIFT